MSKLFSPFTLRKIKFKNRIFVSPMCQYSSPDGMPTRQSGQAGRVPQRGKANLLSCTMGLAADKTSLFQPSFVLLFQEAYSNLF
jgi:2,4-dienoyl-CoA reductase-like NADH-dependent reductase (Old Yellow Enzyme family)